MIRFTCEHCGKPVRIPNTFGGKKGRCPFCNAVVNIPPPAEPSLEEAEAAGLAAAVSAVEQADREPRPEAPRAAGGPDTEDIEPELDTAGDPSHKTDRLDVMPEETAVEAEPPGDEDAEQAGPGDLAAGTKARRVKGLPKPALIGVAAGLVVAIAAGAVLLIWKRPETQPAAKAPQRAALTEAKPVRTAPAKPEPKPQPLPKTTPVPKQAAQVFELSLAIAAAVEEAPAETFAMFRVDFERTAEALAQASGEGGEAVSALASSRFWANAKEEISKGGIPRAATLYLTSSGEATASMFGKFHGARLGNAPAGAEAGLWSLVRPDAPVPHFLLRLTGPAAGNYATALLARAKAMNLPGTFEAGKVASHDKLRMAPPAVAGADKPAEVLIGTVKTIGDAGKPIVDKDLHQRLRELLRRVPAERPVLGCVRLAVARSRLSAATGIEKIAPAWAGQATVLIFSIDPKPTGRADLVLSRASLETAWDLPALVAPMTAVAENGDIRIAGKGTDGLEALAELLPGFREFVLAALAMADEAPVAIQPEPETKPAPPTPAPTPQPAPTPDKTVRFVCINDAQCTKRGQVYEVSEKDVPPDVLAGNDALKCPHCGKRTAAKAVKCPHCNTWYVWTLDVCSKCGKPRK